MKKTWTNLSGFILFAAIFLLVALADVVIVYAYYRYVNNFLSEQPHEYQADAGIIFFGDYADDRVSLGPDSKNRADEAVRLYNKGSIRSIICVGGYDFRRWSGKPHAMRNYLLNQGIPGNRIVHDSLSFNTITNWEEACKIIRSKKYNTVVAISAPLHVFRISRITGSEQVYFHAYEFRPKHFHDYWQLFKDVHREWMSHMLSFALKDRLRNRAVHIYRTLQFEISNVL